MVLICYTKNKNKTSLWLHPVTHTPKTPILFVLKQSLDSLSLCVHWFIFLKYIYEITNQENLETSTNSSYYSPGKFWNLKKNPTYIPYFKISRCRK